ncbi:MAG: hypothetical protein J0L61_10195 [Planctomycetes bacterium]|nr:hypothetical protein [Planctomycetota bacterium]
MALWKRAAQAAAWTVIAAMVLLGFAPPAVSQTEAPTPGSTDQPAPAEGGAAVEVTASGTVQSDRPEPEQAIPVEVEAFGVGDIVREGDWAGVSLVLSDPSAPAARNVAVRLAIKDDDGDTQYVTRTLALSQASRVRAWLYFRVPKQFQGGSVLTVTVHELDPSASAPRADEGVIPVGAQLAYARIGARRVMSEPQHCLIGVIGRRSLRLEQYELRVASGTLPTAQEPSVVVTGLTPENLPDAWVGLAPYEAIVWTEGDPELMEESRRQALREWVHRGGHLVVVLPPVGSSWFNPSSPLSDLMPSVKVSRNEDQSLEPYRALLAAGPEPENPLPAKSVVQSFEPLPGVTPLEASEILSGPHGCVVVRRLVGTGAVTVIGLDLTAGRLAAGVLSADHFWHRVLGRRFDIPQGEAAKDLVNTGGFGFGAAVYADGYVGAEIAKQRAAGVGVLMGLGVFAAYWFIAGPGGFALLKLKKRVHHAWAAFSLATLAFTGVAWAGATAMRPRVTEAQHLTYLTHVYGQPVQSARVWTSILLPDYGDRTVSIGRPDGDKQWKQVLGGWSEPIGNDRPEPFPDARGYSVDTRKLHVARVPARATIRQFVGDWMGGPSWSTPSPVSAEWAPRLIRRGAALELGGKLAHALPGAMQHVKVILVDTQSPESREAVEARTKTTGIMPSAAYAWSLSGIWEPGTELDLSTLAFRDNPRFEQFAFNLVPQTDALGFGTSVPAGVDGRAPDYHMMASLYAMLPQPEWNEGFPKTGRRLAAVRRQAAHGLDLSKWFTQPCLIIIGQVERAPTPVPLTVEGAACPSEGRTVVRWVYPLPSAPARFGFSRPRSENDPFPLESR